MEVDDNNEMKINGINVSDEHGKTQDEEISQKPSHEEFVETKKDISTSNANSVDDGNVITVNGGKTRDDASNDDQLISAESVDNREQGVENMETDSHDKNAPELAKPETEQTDSNSSLSSEGGVTEQESMPVLGDEQSSQDNLEEPKLQCDEVLEEMPVLNSEKSDNNGMSSKESNVTTDVPQNDKSKTDIVIVEEDAVKLETGAINELHLDGFTISVSQDSDGEDTSSESTPQPSREPTPDAPSQTLMESTSKLSHSVQTPVGPQPVSIQASSLNNTNQPVISYVLNPPMPQAPRHVYGASGLSPYYMTYPNAGLAAPQPQRYYLLNRAQAPSAIVSTSPMAQSSMDRVKQMMGMQQSVRTQAPFVPYSMPSAVTPPQHIMPSPHPRSLIGGEVEKPLTLENVANDASLPPSFVKCTSAIPRLTDLSLLPVVSPRPFDDIIVLPENICLDDSKDEEAEDNADEDDGSETESGSESGKDVEKDDADGSNKSTSKPDQQKSPDKEVDDTPKQDLKEEKVDETGTKQVDENSDASSAKNDLHDSKSLDIEPGAKHESEEHDISENNQSETKKSDTVSNDVEMIEEEQKTNDKSEDKKLEEKLQVADLNAHGDSNEVCPFPEMSKNEQKSGSQGDGDASNISADKECDSESAEGDKTTVGKAAQAETDVVDVETMGEDDAPRDDATESKKEVDGKDDNEAPETAKVEKPEEDKDGGDLSEKKSEEKPNKSDKKAETNSEEKDSKSDEKHDAKSEDKSDAKVTKKKSILGTLNLYEDDQDDESSGCGDLRPIPKFLYKIGLDLVQQHTYFNMTKMLLKRAHHGKLDSRGMSHLGIIEKALEKKNQRNWDYNRLKKQKCKGCGFCTESENVLNYHKEEPHQEFNRKLLNCALCDFVTIQSDVFMFHMESEHGRRGRVPVPMGLHQCRFCSFETQSKGKYTKHNFSCEQKYKKMNIQNQAPLPLQIHATLCTIPSAIPAPKKASRSYPTFNQPPGNINLVQLPNGNLTIPRNYVSHHQPAMLQPAYSGKKTVSSALRAQLANRTQQPAIPIAPNYTVFEKCEFCDGLLRDKSALQIHLKMAHGVTLPLAYLTDSPKFRCGACQKLHYTHSGCQLHMKKAHAAVAHSAVLTKGIPQLPKPAPALGANTVRSQGAAVVKVAHNKTPTPTNNYSILSKMNPAEAAPSAPRPVMANVNFRKCHICGEISSNVTAHIALQHNPTMDYMLSSKRCVFCRTIIATKAMLEHHLKEEHNVSPVALGVKNGCFSCGRMYKYPYQLIAHLEKSHGVLCERHCPLCNEMMTATALTAHLIAAHKTSFTSVSKFMNESRCCICLAGLHFNDSVIHQAKHLIEEHGLFFINDSLLARSDISDPVPVGNAESSTCKFCHITFNSRMKLNEHYNKDHVFECKVCGTKFGSEQWLINHYTNTHKMTAELIAQLSKVVPKVVAQPKEDPNSIMQCSLCGQEFKRRTQITHMRRIHTKKCWVDIKRLPESMLPESDRSQRARKRVLSEDIVIIDEDVSLDSSSSVISASKKIKIDEVETISID